MDTLDRIPLIFPVLPNQEFISQKIISLIKPFTKGQSKLAFSYIFWSNECKLSVNTIREHDDKESEMGSYGGYLINDSGNDCLPLN